MDIVYVVRPGDHNPELKYSLRSLQNLPHDQVWIAGYKPSWLKDVNYLPTRPAPTKHRGSLINLWAVALNREISEHFYLFNDDFYVTRQMEEIPLYHRGPYSQYLHHLAHSPGHSGRYAQWAEEAYQELQKWSFSPKSWELHVPMPVQKSRMLRTLTEISDNQALAVNKRSMYATMWDLDGQEIEDVKLYGSDVAVNPLGLLSSSDSDLARRSARKALEQLFPEPSPYEVKK